MNDNGWVKMYRKTENNPIVCKDNDYFRVWHHLLYKANHQTQYVIFNNEKIEIKPGQYITGRKQISEACNVSESKAERILKWFEIEQQIEQRTSSKGRLITIINWNKYQQIEQQFKQTVDNIRTTIDQQTNTNKNDKNDKNDKNVRNNIYNNNRKTTEQTNEKQPNGQTKNKQNSILSFKFLISNFIVSNFKFLSDNNKLKIENKIIEWIKYKQEKNKPYKEQGLKSLLRQIENKTKKYGVEEVIDLIDECMANNYQGIVFDKLKTKPKEEKRQVTVYEEV